jgi:uncharacterized oxidoreductase
MNTTNKKVLITGGGSGIGFEIAKLLTEKGNQVIITGRTESKLKKAADQLRGVHYFASDITREADIDKLVNQVKQQFKGLDLLINNAADAYAYELAAKPGDFDRSTAEITTNYLAVIRLIEKFLPLLSESNEAGIVNVSSIVAFTASNRIPTYAASKAALHFYTQSLRHALAKSSSIKVFELMPPLVNTELSKEIGGQDGIPPQQVAEGLVKALQEDTLEIHIGQTADFYNAFHANASQAYNVFNGIAN